MEAVVWSDYLCPWCYVGTDRTALLETLGVRVTPMPFELHPRIPVEGITLRERWGESYDRAVAMYARIEEECNAVGLPFKRPERVPNTRRVLETAECVRQTWPDAFPALDKAFFAAHFVEGRFLGDPDVVDELVDAAGADAATVRKEVDAGKWFEALRASVEAANDAGATGTPAWFLDNRALIPGVQARETYERVVSRLIPSSSPS
ncbi:MAG TPA: DsbA family protein [Acidimicrobiales bacterium]|nr:DsbA family protein [Acidimicrobiales bacterium]